MHWGNVLGLRHPFNVGFRRVYLETGIPAHRNLAISNFGGVSWNRPDASGENAMTTREIPVIGEERWRICGVPDLGEFANPVPNKQDVVDHHIYLAPDGSWRLWAAIRNAGIGHLIYGWKSSSLETSDWQPDGIKIRAMEKYGEHRAGQEEELVCAPYFVNHDGRWHCLYNSIHGIHMMASQNGVDFERVLDRDGKSFLYAGGRDPMVLGWNDMFLAYSCVTTVSGDGWLKAFVIVRRSKNLMEWSDFTIVSEGGICGNGAVSAESPFVVHRGNWFYLFRSSSTDFNTYVYRSDNPFHFGINDDSKLIATLPIKAPEIIEYKGTSYITDLADFRGIKMARLNWVEDRR